MVLNYFIMGRGLNLAANLLDTALSPNCAQCGKKIKRTVWVNESYAPGKKFCKKSCTNKYVKSELQRNDSGCALCGKVNKSLNYYEHQSKKYCKQKCVDIVSSNAIVLKIDYN